MKTVLLCLLLSGCTSLTAEGRRDLTRDAIHWRHTQCQAQVATVDIRGEDSMRLFRCDAEERAACRAAGLERQCAEWQWGGT